MCGWLQGVNNYLHEQNLPKRKNHHDHHEATQEVVSCVNKRPLSDSSPEAFLYLGFVFHSELTGEKYEETTRNHPATYYTSYHKTRDGLLASEQTRDKRQETTVYKVPLERKAAYFFIKPKIKDARAKRIKTKL